MTETDVGPRASDGWGHGASNQMNTQGFDDTCRVKHQLRKRRIRSSSMSAHELENLHGLYGLYRIF